jgi:hypothetical protein
LLAVPRTHPANLGHPVDELPVINVHMDMRSGFLTVYSADRSEIYGEFADSTWEVEDTPGGENHLFTGTASEGTMDTFRRLNTDGFVHVAFDFEANGERFSGDGQFLAPEDSGRPGEAVIRVETGLAPVGA